nr:acid phosphatase/vanadium-dependent haloperoxidas proteine-related [Tanacetum cinerariifolium]
MDVLNTIKFSYESQDVFEAAMEENDGPDANDYSPDEFDLCEEATGVREKKEVENEHVRYKEHRWDIEQLIGSGGMSPSHSATVTALAIVVGLHDGLGGSTFATAMILACIVMYDATGVRLHVGRQAEVLNQIVFELPAEHPLAESRSLRELFGHAPPQSRRIEILGSLSAYFIALRGDTQYLSMEILEMDTQEKDKNKAKNDKTEHRMEKIRKDKVIRSRKSKPKKNKGVFGLRVKMGKFSLKSYGSVRSMEVGPDVVYLDGD